LANQNYAQQPDSLQSDSPVQSPPKEGGVDAAQSAESGQQSSGAQTSSTKCGNVEMDYAPCLARERADQLFKHCCSQYVPAGCHSLCQYEADELTARNLVGWRRKFIKYFENLFIIYHSFIPNFAVTSCSQKQEM
jgi:hypothetical protein